MNPYADKNYLHAKIHALRSQLLTRNDFIEIINAQKPHLAFPTLISENDSEDLSKVKEIVFRRQIKKVLVFMESSDCYWALFEAFLRFFETGNVKLLLAKAFGRPVAIEQWNDISPYHAFEKDLLRRDISLDEVKTLLGNTYLNNVIADDFPSRYEELESRIDFCAVRYFLSFSKEILFNQRSIFQEVMLRKIVLLRIVWGFRLRENYGWDNDKISSHLASLYDLIDEFDGKDELVINTERQINRELNQSLGRIAEVSDIENELERHFRSYIWRIFSRDFHSIYCVISYLWLLYYQVQNLFRIIEGFRFKVSPDIISKKIISEL
ncbi:MAG: V-type ATPase subunit [Deltaproteobacteria bacterium]|nr:MAG: V-type ATPase subunit [Deltaproteobacteria bacterium]